MKQFCFVTLLCLSAMLCSNCGSPNRNSTGSGATSGSNSNSTPQDLSGNWYITATSSVNGLPVHLDGSIIDAQNQVSASLWQDNQTDNQNNNGSCTAGYLWELNGTQTGTSIPLTTTTANAAGNGESLDISVVASGDGNSLTGNYSVAGGCANGDKGTVVGNRVPPVTGTWSGTVDTTGAISASLTQTPTTTPIVNYGVTINELEFPLSGTVQFTNSPCLSQFSGSLDTANSAVQGNTIYLEFGTNTNEIMGAQGYFSDPSTAKSVTLDYYIESGGCQGQRGTFTISRP